MKKPAMTSGGLPGTDSSSNATVTGTADHLTQPRRPCRVCKRPDARPVVPIGSSRWWDLCSRCAGVVSRREGERVSALREVGRRLHAGGSADAGWIAAQLWDLADLLEVVNHG